MNKLKELLKIKKNNLLNIYCTAGYPNIDSLPSIIEHLENSGVDMIEIGMPYSDPLADGETIQKSSAKALSNGITMDLIFDQIQRTYSNSPLILMGYLNPVLKYGLTKFLDQCKKTGVDGVILPDLPLDIYELQYKHEFESRDISAIFLMTPQTSKVRLKYIDSLSTSFIYAVSSSSTTGNIKGLDPSNEYLNGLKNLSLSCPILVGFNISTKQDLALVYEKANGGIIGSAFIKSLEESQDIEKSISSFIHNLIPNSNS